MKPIKLLPIIVILSLITMMLFTVSCLGDSNSGSSQVKGDTSTAELTAGAYADVHVTTLADGTLYAVAIDLIKEDDDEGDDEGDDQGENENDGNDEGENESDDDDQGENEDDDVDDDGENDDNDEDDDNNEDDDDDDNDDNDEGDKEKFEVTVDSIVADLSSFIVYGSLLVMMEPDDGDANQENDPADGPDDLEIPDLSVGQWIEAKGAFDVVAGIFYAEEIKARTDGETDASIESLIDTVTDGSITMLGLTITYDANTQINAGDDNEDDGENDTEQEGDYQGEY